MHTHAGDFYENWPATIAKLKAMSPEIGKAFGPFFHSLMKDSDAQGLSLKHKELMAMAIGIAVRCEPCIYAHVEKCLQAGATSQEIIDAAGVAVMMGGGPTYTYVPIVLGALEHFQNAAVATTSA